MGKGLFSRMKAVTTACTLFISVLVPIYSNATEAIMTVQSEEDAVPYITSRNLAVPFFDQYYDNYCGPATLKQTYHFLNNNSWSPSLSSIANDVNTSSSGTEQAAMENYLDLHFPSYNYETVWKGGSSCSNVSSFMNLVKSDINAQKPIIANIEIDGYLLNNSGWIYTTGGHYLNISGYVLDASGNDYIVVTDPYLAGHNISTGKYNISKNDFYNALERMLV